MVWKIPLPAKRGQKAPVKQILITVGETERRVAILEGRALSEIYVEREKARSIIGNIYLGRVQNVLPGMEAAFVDIGENRNAFLSVDDVAPIADEAESIPTEAKPAIRAHQNILVQVTRAPSNSKGARLTTQVAIPSRYLVLVPQRDFIGISRRIGGKERERLSQIVEEIKPEKMGLIVRTAAEGEGKLTLLGDLSYLLGEWQQIQVEAEIVKPASIVYQEKDITLRIVRDVFSRDYKRILVDSREKYEEICAYLSEIDPHLTRLVHLYRRREPLFKKYRIDEQITDALKPKIWLRSGGHTVINETEALTAIDVNTGKYIGRVSLEKTILKTNLEAAQEIARQLKLRDIGGLIVVDFINMEDPANREEVLQAFTKALEQDRAKTEVVEISRLGLVEMTRKGFTPGLRHYYTKTCPQCEGKGYIPKQ